MEKLERRSEATGKKILLLVNNAFSLHDGEKALCGEWIKFVKQAIIRCVSGNDVTSQDFMLCVEWKDRPWQDREWIHVNDFHEVYIEDFVVVSKHPVTKQELPACAFYQAKGTRGRENQTLVEFFSDCYRCFLHNNEYAEIKKSSCLNCLPSVIADSRLAEKISDWINLQHTQKLFTQNSYCLAGTRIHVYWPNSSIQWISAVVTGHDTNGQLQIMTDQVLTQTTVDPRLTQVKLLDDSILSELIPDGVSNNIRRSRRSTRFSSSSSMESPSGKPSSKQRAAKRRSGSDRVNHEADSSKVVARKPQTTSYVDNQIDPQTNHEGQAVSVDICDIPQRTNVNHVQDGEQTADEETKCVATLLLSMSSNAVRQAKESTSQSDQNISYTTSGERPHLCKDNVDKNTTKHPDTISEHSRNVGVTVKDREEMHQNTNARNLSAISSHQALQQQQQQQQQQQGGQPSHVVPLPQQFIANPYLPYGFPLLYGNPTLSGAMAHLHAAAANGLVPSPNLVTPFVNKTLQQDMLEKEFQQQILANYALLGANREAALAAYQGIYRPDGSSLPTTSSAKPPNPVIIETPTASKEQTRVIEQYKHDRHHLSSPTAMKSGIAKKSTPSVKTPTPRRHPDPSLDRGRPLHFSPSRNMSPNHPATSTHIIEERDKLLRIQDEEKRRLQEEQRKTLIRLEAEAKLTEERWKNKFKFNPGDVAMVTESQQKERHKVGGTVDTNHGRQWLEKTSHIAPFGKIDPTTYMARAAQYYFEDDAKANGVLSESGKMQLGERKVPFIASSCKTWQPPVVTDTKKEDTRVQSSPSRVIKKPPTTTSTMYPAWPYGSYPQNQLVASSAGKPATSIININSLKYSPGSGRPPRTTVDDIHAGGIHPDKGIPMKSSFSQPVKYINERDAVSHKTQTVEGEELGPLMQDGSHARVLSPNSLSQLYHFPKPAETKSPQKATNSVIINGGHYKVTEVHGNNESVQTHVGNKPSHIVYPKQQETNRPSPPAEMKRVATDEIAVTDSDKINRKRMSVDPDTALSMKKPCPDPPSPAEEQKNDSPNHVQKMMSGKDPYLAGLAQAGLFHLNPSKIMWKTPSSEGQYPGAPSKLVLKDALLGVKYGRGQPQPVHSNGLLLAEKVYHQNEVKETIAEKKLENSQFQTSEDDLEPINLSSKPLIDTQGSTPQLSDNHANPKSLVMELSTTNSDVKPKTSSGVSAAVSPSSDASSISEFSSGSSSGKIHPVIPEVLTVAGTPTSQKPAVNICPKMKKAWLQRMSDESDDAPRSPANKPSKRRNSGDDCITASPELNDPPAQEDMKTIDPLAPPLKKPKKKHRKQDKDKKPKDPNKKKKKHKDKDLKKIKKSPDHTNDPSSPGESLEQEKDDEEGSGKRCLFSNSKKYLLGLLTSMNSFDEEEINVGELHSESGDGKKKKNRFKKKDVAEMPLGENGLPMSILYCKKEQSRLKRSGEHFMQDAACHEISGISGISVQSSANGSTMIPKCRECRSVKRKENSAIFCRFYHFRKLSFVNGQLQAVGFCDPEDSEFEDLSLWLPKYNDKFKVIFNIQNNPQPSIDLEACKYIMSHIGGQFCELVHEEKEALVKVNGQAKVCWKRPVTGVREMCDACETTLFNLHWVCPKCGFGVCCDCYNTRQAMTKEVLEVYDSDKNNLYRWMRCTKGKHHHTAHLMPTQIIPSTCLFDLCEMAHQARIKWNIGSQCRCKKISASLLASRSSNPTPLLKNHCHNEMLSHNSSKASGSSAKNDPKNFYDCESSASPLDWLASIALREQRKSSPSDKPPSEEKVCGQSNGEQQAVQKLQADAKLSSNLSRSWFCNGQLPKLDDPSPQVDVDTFQMHWFCGMPVVGSGATKYLNRDLWRPQAICAEHGDEPTRNALINCRKGSVITNAYIKDFWNGFESIKDRLVDEESGEKMILKLKDWPTTEDFIDTMPAMFDDLMNALPLSPYTARNGKYNIAAHLPDFFVRPDLGPKMYIAYGWVTEDDWSQGTTNLHLDISDACNLMVYVGVPSDEPEGARDTLLKIIKEGDVDDAQIERVQHHKPGALWHIFKASDTDKIRNFIVKMKAEKGVSACGDHDPIHDQQVYLDKALRKRLLEEYGVEAFPIVQCEGDSVFIPAGAPHQVFNLHSCIKVAEDFVSPEHVDKCYKLMEEFRHLSSTHSNHEDKLQLKNIIYHSMKEVVSSLSWFSTRGDNGQMKSPPHG